MKKVVTVSLGSSKQDFVFETDFLGQRFQVRRLGADDDTTKAWELMRRHQSQADAIGLGEIGDHYQVGLNSVMNKETKRLLNMVTRVPSTTDSPKNSASPSLSHGGSSFPKNAYANWWNPSCWTTCRTRCRGTPSVQKASPAPRPVTKNIPADPVPFTPNCVRSVSR